jgi:hypothetical protein
MPPPATPEDVKVYRLKVEKDKITPHNLPPCPPVLFQIFLILARSSVDDGLNFTEFFDRNVTKHAMAFTGLPPWWFFIFTNLSVVCQHFSAPGTARVKFASLRWVECARNITPQADFLLLGFWISYRYGRQKRLCVWVIGRIIYLLSRADLYNLAEIHDSDIVRKIADNAKVMRDEYHGGPKNILYFQ